MIKLKVSLIDRQFIAATRDYKNNKIVYVHGITSENRKSITEIRIGASIDPYARWTQLSTGNVYLVQKPLYLFYGGYVAEALLRRRWVNNIVLDQEGNGRDTIKFTRAIKDWLSAMTRLTERPQLAKE